jgi:hypothetical protein
MLSRKQQWRRTSKEATSPRTKCSRIRFEEALGKQNETVSRTTSESGLPQKKLVDQCVRRWTFSNLVSCKATPPKRKVRFSDTNHVILVPCRVEYFHRNMQDDIWWSECHLSEMKDSAREEVNDYRNAVHCDVHTAIRHLYQPIEVIQQKPYGTFSQPDETNCSLIANVNFLDVKPKHAYVQNETTQECPSSPDPIPLHPLAYLVY